MTRVSLLAALACLAAGGAMRAQTVFRSGVDVVSVDVSVRLGNTPVTGLTAADFTVTDNGVVQRLEAVLRETLPIDVTMLLDVSSSTDGRMLQGLKQAVRDTSSLLTPRDRLRLIALTQQVRSVFDFQPGGAEPSLANLAAAGATSLFDGLAAAMMGRRVADRRHLILAFTDGRDTLSYFDDAALTRIARLADAVVDIAVGLDRRNTVENKRLLEDVTRATGGDLVTFDLRDSLSGHFKRLLDDFRTSYVLQYSPQGVTRAGWHDIVVKIVKPGRYDVRARKGYDGG